MKPSATPPASVTAEARDALVREILDRIADKWTLFVIDALEEDGELRFSRLRRRVQGVSQKMLTRTLRQLERDGLVTRRVHAVIPPRVDYKLTSRGKSLAASLCGLWTWAARHALAVEESRRVYDARAVPRESA